MTREERIAGLMKIAGFFEARADMAVGDAKMLLLNWAGCAETAARELKAQEPRVMTLDEYRAIAERPLEERVPVWLEWRCVGHSRWTIPERAYQGYGDTWRCWTDKPGEAERKAIPWTE